MYQPLWGYKVEEKLYLGVREQKRLNTTALEHWGCDVLDNTMCSWLPTFRRNIVPHRQGSHYTTLLNLFKVTSRGLIAQHMCVYKGKTVQLVTMQAPRGRGDIAPTHF
jgi:hypothetical protein